MDPTLRIKWNLVASLSSLWWKLSRYGADPAFPTVTRIEFDCNLKFCDLVCKNIDFLVCARDAVLPLLG